MGKHPPPYEIIAPAEWPDVRAIHGTDAARQPGCGMAEAAAGATAAADAFYVEFRAARIGLYGHSYITYGRLTGDRRPASANHADIHPDGGFFSMVLGHFLPMTAAMGPVEETLRRTLVHAYRCELQAAEHDSLLQAIVELQAARRTWNVFAYNCNDFVADVARDLGLRTPRTLVRSYTFIAELGRLNGLEPAVPRDAPSGETVSRSWLPRWRTRTG
jgi:hypothetical protein